MFRKSLFLITILMMAHGSFAAPWPTSTPEPWPTDTPVPSPSPWPISTPDPYPTDTPIPSPTPWPTSTPIPWPTETPIPIPNPTEEFVKFRAQFQTESCEDSNHYGSCSIFNSEPWSNVMPLKDNGTVCSIANPQPPSQGNNPPTLDVCPKNSEAHWATVYYGIYGKRYIGIISIKKSVFPMTVDGRTETQIYNIEVEILGGSKTLAKMTGELTSWDLLQPTGIIVDEVEDPYRTTRVIFRFGPFLDPQLNPMAFTSKNKGKAPVWKVHKGQILK